MTTPQYRKALDEATREYEALIKQRAELDHRIAHLAQSIGHLTRLCGLVPTVPWGLTEACRMVLKAAGHPLTAVEARAQLEAMGFDLSRYTNDLAAIHTILKRLTDSGEAELVPRAWEKPGYRWAQTHDIALGRPKGRPLHGGTASTRPLHGGTPATILRSGRPLGRPKEKKA